MQFLQAKRIIERDRIGNSEKAKIIAHARVDPDILVVTSEHRYDLADIGMGDKVHVETRVSIFRADHRMGSFIVAQEDEKQ